MTSINLSNIPDSLLGEWKSYALQSGLPLEYLIQEAVTYSVRSDRLGIEAAKIVVLQKQKQLRQAQKTLKEASSTEGAISSLVPQESTDDSLLPLAQGYSNEFMDSDDSAAALDDHVPRNL